MTFKELDSKFNDYKFETLGYVKLPEVVLTPEEQKLAPDITTNKEFLAEISRQGMKKRFIETGISKQDQPKYLKQLQYELDTFEQLHFTNYPLLVWRSIEAARREGEYIDTGRGSAVSSCVFYALGVTGVDPIAKQLFFSRFVSKTRAKFKEIDGETWLRNDLIPDADLNLGSSRDKVLDWLHTLYPNRICNILTLSTLQGKILVKDTFKAVELASETVARDIADKIEKHFGVVQDIESTYKESEDFKAWADEHPKTYDIALKLRGLNRQASVHASGKLISYTDLNEITPLQLDSKKNLISAFTMEYAPAVKLDLLGLDTNFIIKNVIELTGVDVTKINLDDDPFIYDKYQSTDLKPYGLYQISSDFAYKVCTRVKPKNVYELSDVNALARPGSYEFEARYIKNKNEPVHAVFKEVVSWTRNLFLYQEQLLRALILIGFTPDDAETCRKIVGKKKLEQVKEWKDRIYSTAKKNEFPEKVADILWGVLEASSNYSFNLSHSVATSYTTALTTYLKYKYPLEWFVSCLRAVKFRPKPLESINQIVKELPFFNIKLLPPHLRDSDIDFTVENGNIRFGLTSIRGLGPQTIEKLIRFKKPHANKFDMFTSASEAGLSIGALAALIQAGAMDGMYDQPRSKIVLEAQTWWQLTEREKKLADRYAEQCKHDIFAVLAHLQVTNDEKGKPLIKPGRIETIRKKYRTHYKIYKTNFTYEDFACYWYEKELLGFAYSSTLKQIFSKAHDNLSDIIEIGEKGDNEYCSLIGFCDYIHEATARNEKKTRYMRFDISDDTGRMSVFLYNEKIPIHKKGTPVREGDVVLIEGKKFNNGITIRTIVTQKHDVYMKLSDIKKMGGGTEISGNIEENEDNTI